MSHIGYAEPKRILLGNGDIYVNNTFVGQLKENVALTYTPSYAYARPGNALADIKGVRIGEEAMITAQVFEWKPAQLRIALGLNQAVASAAATLRKQEVLKLSATANVSTTETMTAGTLKVFKLDRASQYVSSTDYSATSTTIARKTGGAITAGQYVIAEYNFSDSGAVSVLFGGEKTAPNTFQVDFVVEQSTGKRIQVTFYKAMFSTEFSAQFNQLASGDFTTYGIRIKALVDMTKPEGQNLGAFIFEDDAS